MSKGYDAPAEVRELEKLINEFTYRNGFDVQNVFRDLLRYIINGFSLPDTPPLADWRYTPEQCKSFHEMFTAWVKIMDKQIKIHGYYDAFGALFMALTSQRGQQQSGQFFTPDHLAKLCQQVVVGNSTEQKVETIYDPAVGSGRMLIAHKIDKPTSYLVGWDIDYTCCLMCVCNFLMNSCVGEVVCIDTLRMENFRGAWIVNESFYRTGLPSIRWMNETEYVRFQRAGIPAYVYFLDQENYDEYFRMRGIWANISTLLREEPQPPTADNEPTAEQTSEQEPASA